MPAVICNSSDPRLASTSLLACLLAQLTKLEAVFAPVSVSLAGFTGITFVMSQRAGSCMQVCNHPDLFEGRPIVSAFDMPPLSYHLPSPVLTALAPAPWASVSPALLRMASPPSRGSTAWRAALTQVKLLVLAFLPETSRSSARLPVLSQNDQKSGR